MKRLFLILTVLFISVLTTACINNLAIQELNNKAKEYMDAGEVDKAICRYRSSLDLDESVFETNYNLGVAYIAANDNEAAVETLKNSLKINATIADVYYSLGVAEEGMAYDLINGKEKSEINCKEYVSYDMDTEKATTKKKKLTESEKERVARLFMDAVDSYNQYLAMNTTANDKDKVNARIDALNEELVKYSIPQVEDAHKAPVGD